jgi:predicted enzyme related to lactoylglutathione lyase
MASPATIATAAATTMKIFERVVPSYNNETAKSRGRGHHLAAQNSTCETEAQGGPQHINVRDLARSIRFYQEAFGLKVGFSAGKALIFMVPEARGHSLALHQVGPDEPVGMAGGFQHFGFKLDLNDHDRVIKQVEKARDDQTASARFEDFLILSAAKDLPVATIAITIGVSGKPSVVSASGLSTSEPCRR